MTAKQQAETYRHGEGPHSVNHLERHGTGKSQIIDKHGSICAIVFDAPRLARRFGAADEMLAALKKIVNHWGNLHPKDLQQARAAIAKAEQLPQQHPVEAKS